MKGQAGDGEAEGPPPVSSMSPTPDSGPGAVEGRPEPPSAPPALEEAGARRGPSGKEEAMVPAVNPIATAGASGGVQGPPPAFMSPMGPEARLGAGAVKPNKRMPRDPVTNQRICFEFVRGACARPPGTCRYAHVVPPAHVYQQMQPFGVGGGAAGAGALPAPSPLLQHHLQRLSRELQGAAPTATGAGPGPGAGMDGEGDADGGSEGTRCRNYFLPHLRKSTMPLDEPSQRRVCFYYNVMKSGCRKPAAECEFAHVYVEGALEARQEAEAQGFLPRSCDVSERSLPEESSVTAAAAAPNGRAPHPVEGDGQQHNGTTNGNPPHAGAPPPPPPPQQQQQQHPSPPRLVASSGRGIAGSGGGGRRRRERAPPPIVVDGVLATAYVAAPGYYSDGSPMAGGGFRPPPGAAYGYDAYGNPSLQPQGSYAGVVGGGGGAVYVGGGGSGGGGGGGGEGLYAPSKTYIHMPRTASGQRVCYYHNVGKCTNRVCPFVHVLINMNPLRASAVSIPLERNSSNESTSSGGSGGGGARGGSIAMVRHGDGAPLTVNITGGPIVLGAALPHGMDEMSLRAAVERAGMGGGDGVLVGGGQQRWHQHHHQGPPAPPPQALEYYTQAGSPYAYQPEGYYPSSSAGGPSAGYAYAPPPQHNAPPPAGMYGQQQAPPPPAPPGSAPQHPPPQGPRR